MGDTNKNKLCDNSTKTDIILVSKRGQSILKMLSVLQNPSFNNHIHSNVHLITGQRNLPFTTQLQGLWRPLLGTNYSETALL